MATRLRKVRRLRGSRTHGWGQVAQHRRTGAKGGSGMAGLHKHKWSYMVKYAPDHFGSNRWHPPHPATTNRWLNVYDLESLASSGSTLDLGAMGYEKLLGQGSISKALTVKVPRASASAIEKVKSAGGTVTVEYEAKPEKPEPKKGEPQKQPPKEKGSGGQKPTPQPKKNPK